MLLSRTVNGIFFLDRGDYIEIPNEIRSVCLKVRFSSKGKYVIYNRKRFYIDNNVETGEAKK